MGCATLESCQLPRAFIFAAIIRPIAMKMKSIRICNDKSCKECAFSLVVQKLKPSSQNDQTSSHYIHSQYPHHLMFVLEGSNHLYSQMCHSDEDVMQQLSHYWLETQIVLWAI